MNLAQFNIAIAKYALDTPEIKEFADNYESIYAIAEASDGFVWRLNHDSDDLTSLEKFDTPNMFVTMSVWTSVESLKEFMFKTRHRDFMSRRSEWFHHVSEDTYVLWWIEDNHIPTVEEGLDHLDYLRKHGDSPYAFTLKTNYTEAA